VATFQPQPNPVAGRIPGMSSSRFPRSFAACGGLTSTAEKKLCPALFPRSQKASKNCFANARWKPYPLKPMNITKLALAGIFALVAATGAYAAEAKKSCCDKAKEAGKACEHPCCVKATADGKVCEKCNKK
jgi:hypothetical protein